MKHSSSKRSGFVLAGFAAFSAAFGVLSAFAAENAGTTVQFRLQNDQTVIDVKQKFSPGKTVQDVRAIFADSSLLPEISDVVFTATTIPINATTYRLETKGGKSVAGIQVTATTVSQCTEQSGTSSWSRTCRLVLDRTGKDTPKYMRSGMNVTRCEEVAIGKSSRTQVVCTHHFEVQPKPINKWPVYVRNAQELGAAGAKETVSNLGIMLLLTNTRQTPRQAKASFADSSLGALSDRMFNEAKELAVNNSLGSRALVIKYSDISGSYSKSVE